jgi:hypothetical protein
LLRYVELVLVPLTAWAWPSQVDHRAQVLLDQQPSEALCGELRRSICDSAVYFVDIAGEAKEACPAGRAHDGEHGDGSCNLGPSPANRRFLAGHHHVNVLDRNAPNKRTRSGGSHTRRKLFAVAKKWRSSARILAVCAFQHTASIPVRPYFSTSPIWSSNSSLDFQPFLPTAPGAGSGPSRPARAS